MAETMTLSPNRINGIGGSEAAAVLGLSKWKTPYQVWLDKTGQSGEREASGPMEWGLLLEPVIRQKYSNVTGRTVRLPGHLQSERYPFMLCTLDGITDDGPRGVEIKTARSSADWGEEGTDEIPQAYVIQTQHNMEVADLEVCDVPVLFAGSDFRIYEVHRDRELQALMIEQEAEFWAMVEANTPPPPITYADAIRRFATSQAQTVTATPEVLAAVEVLRTLKVSGKDAEEAEKEAKFAVLLALGEADTLVDAEGNVLLTYKQARGSDHFDAKAFAEAQPDLFQQFLKPSVGSRRLLLKGGK